MERNYPDPIADDAPTPEEADGETVSETVLIGGRRYLGADHDGARYCIDCVNIEYLEYAIENPRKIPYGGPYPAGAEVDCPGSACDNCHRRFEGETVLHYDAVCGEYCTAE